jgi:hypothetical protein
VEINVAFLQQKVMSMMKPSVPFTIEVQNMTRGSVFEAFLNSSDM